MKKSIKYTEFSKRLYAVDDYSCFLDNTRKQKRSKSWKFRTQTPELKTKKNTARTFLVELLRSKYSNVKSPICLICISPSNTLMTKTCMLLQTIYFLIISIYLYWHVLNLTLSAITRTYAIKLELRELQFSGWDNPLSNGSS